MPRPTKTTGALLGFVTSFGVIALLYLADQLAGLPFLPFDLFDWIARVLPGDVITLGIDAIVNIIATLNLGDTSSSAKLLEQIMGLSLLVIDGTLLGVLIAWLMDRRLMSGTAAGALIGGLFFVFFAAVEIDFGLQSDLLVGLLWLALVIIGWGVLLGRWLAATAVAAAKPTVDPAARRAILLKLLGGSAGLAVAAWGVGRLGQTPAVAESGAAVTLPELPTEPSATATALATTRERLEPAPGTRAEVTPDGEFYRIDINSRPIAIDGESWELEVAGLFDNPRNLSLKDLMAYPAVTQALTMSCISNAVGGDLIGTTFWTGPRLRDVLEDLGLQREAVELFITSSDGFFESVSMMDMMDPRTLLVYAMNGETLPERHGFPLRVYIPNRYGMKQPKWIAGIEAIDEEGPGYWVQRGWSAEAYPRVVSVIDSIATDAATNGVVPVGGIAWAGDRGIQKVEVQADDGPWEEAMLRLPPLSELTWVQWRYDWPATDGRHTLRVRATDGRGEPQIAEVMPKRPDGATGYHELSVTV